MNIATSDFRLQIMDCQALDCDLTTDWPLALLTRMDYVFHSSCSYAYAGGGDA
jgi:hypothetical protein